MISDDFGDRPYEALSGLQGLVEAPWVLHMAKHFANRSGGRIDAEDLAQEARIEMWKRAERWDGRGSIEGFLRKAAEYRIRSLLWDNRSLTGQEAERSGGTQRRGDETRDRLKSAVADLRKKLGREPKVVEVAEAVGMTSQSTGKQLKKLHLAPTEVKAQVESLDAMIEAYGTEAVFEAVDIYDSLVLAYHYGEIHQAVSDLKPLYREYVYLRFWMGYGDLEAARALGARAHWVRDIRPVLQERLSHLAGAL